MIATPDNRQQRQLAVTILIAVVLSIFSVTMLPLWIANAARNEDIRELQQRPYHL